MSKRGPRLAAMDRVGGREVEMLFVGHCSRQQARSCTFGVGAIVACLLLAGPVGAQEHLQVRHAEALLSLHMPVAAAELLEEAGHLAADDGLAGLTVARAYADQRAWRQVLATLEDLHITARTRRVEAAVLRARAHWGLGEAGPAVTEYRRALAGTEGVPALQLRVGLAYAEARRGQWGLALEQLVRAEQEHAQYSRWLRLARFLLMAEAENTQAFALADSIVARDQALADTVLLAASRLAFSVGEAERGIEFAKRASPAVRDAVAARYVGPYMLAQGDTAAAVEAFARAIRSGRQLQSTGPSLLALDRSWERLRDVARSDARAGRHGRAGGFFQEALTAAPEGAVSARAELATELAEALLAQGRPGPAAQVLHPWLDRSGDGASATMWLMAARVNGALGRDAARNDAYRKAAQGQGRDAAYAAYLLADQLQDNGDRAEAEEAFEYAATRFTGISYGSRALERAAMLAWSRGDLETARAHLRLYRQLHGDEDWIKGALYWSGRVEDALGNPKEAKAFYRRAFDRDPLDYYAILSAPHLGETPGALLARRDIEGAPSEPLSPVYEEALERMDVLRGLGWMTRAQTEYREALDEGPATYGQVLALAHALIDRGWARQGILQGWRAHAIRGVWTRPLLTAIYPLPYRAALVSAAQENGLSPHFVAGLSRRESMFDPEIVSVANAVGLMQLLPETAREVSPRAGLSDYSRTQLTVPEVNLRLGTRYLSEILEQADGAPVAGMISYNAGPHRYQAWKDFQEFRNKEELVERIPYRETREYVRAVTELEMIYRVLYPELEAGLMVPSAAVEGASRE